MRIGLFTPYLDSLSGGEKYVLTMASCLSKKHSVSIFWDPSKETEVKKSVKEKFDLSLGNISFRENIFSSEIPLVARLIKSKKYDRIIYLSDGSLPLSASLMIVHFQFPVEWVNKTVREKVKLLRAKKIIVNSFFTKKFIDRKFGVRSTVVYPPCDTDFGKVKKENIILTVGRFGRDIEGKDFKKQKFMMSAFKKIKPKGWKFVVAVSFREEERRYIDEYESIAKDADIEIVKNPKHSILKSLNEKAKIYWHAAGFGEDIEKFPEKAEHFGISTVEAMAAGAVPIVINAGGQKEIVSDGEDGFLWNKESELLEKTKNILKNEKMLEEFSKRARKSATKFSKERFCKEVFGLI